MPEGSTQSVASACLQNALMKSGMPGMTQAENHLLSMDVTIAENETTHVILLEDLVVQREL